MENVDYDSMTNNASIAHLTKFKPKPSLRFIFEFGDISPFAIESVKLPPVKPNWFGKLKPKKNHCLIVKTSCPVSPSIEKQIAKTIKGKYRSANIKYLDSNGSTVAQFEFVKPKIQEINFTESNYKNKEPLECELLVRFSELRVL